MPLATDGEGPSRIHQLTVAAILSHTKKGPATIVHRRQPPREKEEGGDGWSPAIALLGIPLGYAGGSALVTT
jgi:hypothetical protein